MKKALSWEINASDRSKLIKSDPFSSGGCEWFLRVHPRSYRGSDNFSLFLHVKNPRSLSPGWKRSVSYCFVFLNQSGKELYRSPDECRLRLYCSSFIYWGYKTNVTLTEFQEQGLLENDKLIIEVYINVVEVVPPVMTDFNGFQILSSQAVSVGKIYAEHPDFALDFKPSNKGVKTAYMNLLLGLIETLDKSPQSLFVTELTNAQRELTDLTEAGFKLDWLNSKLEEVFLERKKALSDGSWVEQLEERVKTLELALSDRKVELDKEHIKSVATARPSSFEIIDIFIKRFFLSCFSISKY